LPAPTGMELGSITRIRLAATELVECGAAQVALKPVAKSASSKVILFIDFHDRSQRNWPAGSTCAGILRPGFAPAWGASARRTFSAQFVVFMVAGTQRNFESARAMRENLNRPSCGNDGV